jgi:hypothetical protein
LRNFIQTQNERRAFCEARAYDTNSDKLPGNLFQQSRSRALFRSLWFRNAPAPQEAAMKKTLTGFLAVATIAVTLATAASDASAYWRGRGWGWRGGGWGPGVAAGVIGGAVIAGAIIASRPQGYVVYPGYAQPVYGPGCYWASQPVYDAWGHVVGYMGQPVQVCPGYVAAPPPPAYGPPPPPAELPVPSK